MTDSVTSSYWVETEDWHTAGEPFRIVPNPPFSFPEDCGTVSLKRSHILRTHEHPADELRRLLCHEPRGHAGMYGGFITAPDGPGAHFGVLFWHRDGFSTACGHGTIALGYWAIHHNKVQFPKDSETVDVVIDVPSGRVVARMGLENGTPKHADFINVTSFQVKKPFVMDLSFSKLEVLANLVFAGAVYATVDTAQLGLSIKPQNAQRFVQLAQEIIAWHAKRALYLTYELYGVIFHSELPQLLDGTTDVVVQKNVTVFADGQIDRSPCGSGTCARLAGLLAEGGITTASSRLVHFSIIDSKFEAEIVSVVASPVQEFPACVPRVRGRAGLVGQMKFFIDSKDDVFPGFLL